MSSAKVFAVNNVLAVAMLSVFLGSFSYVANADELPPLVRASLQQRENRLRYLTFAWQIALKQSAPDRSQEEVAGMQKAIELQLPGQLRKEGIVDENAIHQQVEAAKRQAPSTMKGFSYSSSNVWHFVRHDTQTLVTGTKQLGGSRVNFTQYYDRNSGMIANTGNYIGNARPLRNDDPNIWASPGDSIRYRSLFQESLGLLPEHYSMLLGLNPLSMYGAKWSLVSTTPTAWTMQAIVSQNNFAPFIIQLVLSRKYNGVPVQLQVRSKDEAINLQVEGFQQVGGDWIASRAIFSDKWLGYLTTNQTWVLQNVTKSKPIVVTLSQKQLVHDYRLLGPNLMIRGLYPVVSKQQQESIIYYRWPGHFLSDEELKQIYQKQNLGEATPDLGQAGSGPQGALASASNMIGSAMPFAGGVLCLVGGVWMFKQSRAN